MKRFLIAALCALGWLSVAHAQSLPSPTFGTVKAKVINTIRYASQYGQADWCANVNAALADLGTNAGTIIVDGNQTISACSAVAEIDLGANHILDFISGGTFVLSEPIKIGANSHVIGTGGGKVAAGSNGAVLQASASFPTNTPLVEVWDATRGSVSNLVLDCNSVSGCVGIKYDSDNNPISTLNTFEHLTIQNAHVAFACGSLTTPNAITGISVTGAGPYTATYTVSGTLPWAVGSTHGVASVAGATASGLNFSNGVIDVTSSTTFTYSFSVNPGTWTSGGHVIYGDEADYARIEDVIASSDGADTSAVGIQINSANCLQESQISRVYGSGLHYLVNGIASNGTMKFQHMNAGNWTGSGNVAFSFGDYWGGPYTIENAETEGTAGTGTGQLQYALLDSAGTAAGGRSGVSTLINNNFNIGTVDIFGYGSYVSIGNTISGTAEALGFVSLCSMQDAATWTTAGDFNLLCSMQGTGTALSSSPASSVTINNSSTPIVHVSAAQTGLWLLNASVSLSGASSATNVTCSFSDGTTTFGSALGNASTTDTNISLSAIASHPVADIYLNCLTGTAGATATVNTASTMTAVSVH